MKAMKKMSDNELDKLIMNTQRFQIVRKLYDDAVRTSDKWKNLIVQHHFAVEEKNKRFFKVKKR